MKKKTAQILLLAWSGTVNKLKLIKEQIPSLPEEETHLPDGLEEKDFGFILVTIEEIKKLKDYLCIMNKGKVLSQESMPIFFNKQLKNYCRNIAYELEGSYPFKYTFIRRADKVLKGLVKLGFTPKHKVAIFTLKEKGKDNINYIRKDKVMNKIKKIEVIYKDGRRIMIQSPDTEALDDISESIKSKIILSQEPSINTHIVYKREYFKGAPSEVIANLVLIDDYYKNIRIKLNKSIEPTYMVVNNDEPYAERIQREILIGESMKLNLRKGIDEVKNNSDTNAETGRELKSNTEDIPPSNLK